jgi:hypothetical protein
VLIDPIYDETGELIGFAKITRDITERKQAEEELEEARAALAQSQKLQALGELTGGIAHDFNNLLTVIRGSAELLQRPRSPTRSAAAICPRSETADRATTLTNHLLAFGRRQALKPEVIERARLGRRAARRTGSASTRSTRTCRAPRSSARRRPAPARGAVDHPAGAQPPLLGQRCASAARLHDPREPQELVEPQALSHAAAPPARRRRGPRRGGGAGAAAAAAPDPPASPFRGGGSRCPSSAARPPAAEAERGGERLVHHLPACRRAPRGRGGRAARPCRRGASAARARGSRAG